MWVWLIVSLIVLAACIVFALRIFFGNYGITSRGDVNLFGKNRKKYESYQQERLVTDLKTKLQSIEDNSLLYLDRINKMQKRLEEMETRGPEEKRSTKKYQEEEENWKEMYYLVLDEKEKLQEQYDIVK